MRLEATNKNVRGGGLNKPPPSQVGLILHYFWTFIWLKSTRTYTPLYNACDFLQIMFTLLLRVRPMKVRILTLVLHLSDIQLLAYLALPNYPDLISLETCIQARELKFGTGTLYISLIMIALLA